MAIKKHFCSLILSVTCIPAAFGADVPAVLPRPDQTPPSDGKVKVYILAGQSNMVGFGKYSGARPLYKRIYLSADPTAVPCRMPVGSDAITRFEVHLTASADSPKVAQVSVFKGAYQDGKDYSKATAIEETTVALGNTSEKLPTVKGDHTVVAKAFITVPMSGNFLIHAGYEDSTYATVDMDGQEVYRKNPGEEAKVTKVSLEAGVSYPIVITYMKGGSAALWLEHVDIKGKGDLATLNKEGKYLWLVDDEGKPTQRNDVIYTNVRTSSDPIGSAGLLHTKSNGRFIGPEVPFGYVMGTFHDEPVLLLESSMGNRALSFDFRPPSSPKSEEDKANKYCGYEYNAMVDGVRDVLKNIDKVVPGYKGQGYEIVGFAWFQGHKDGGSSKAEYEGHLVNLINDLRKDLDAPDMKAVVATVGFGGMTIDEPWVGVHAAQMAVGDPRQHPEFKGSVASVDTRPFWRSMGDSPTGTGYHYNHNAETYVLTGDALGRAMVELLGGEVEEVDVVPPPALHPDVERIYSESIANTWFDAPERRDKGERSENPSKEGYLAMMPALKPILAEQMIPAYIENTVGKDRVRMPLLPLENILSGQKPSRFYESIESQLDALVAHYELLGINEYSWVPVVPGMRTAEWNYYSFDPPEKQPLEKSFRLREITFPEGMENWMSPDFDPVKAGWKVGNAPFGQMDGKQMGRKISPCYAAYCECHRTPATFWEKEVLLMQQTFDLPPLKEDHAYRIVMGGANCDRSGEGYQIYVNGKLLKEAKGGYFRTPGLRGAYLFKDALPEFKGGKVTIAVRSHLRYTHFRDGRVYFGDHPAYVGKTVPPNGHVSLWIEESRIPQPVLGAASQKQ